MLHDWRNGGLDLWQDSRWFGSRVNFDESEKQYTLRVELPGYEPGDIDVKVSGDMLTLRAEHKEEGKEKNGGSFQHYGSFYESFTLPKNVLANQVDARYHSGVLEVHLPKSEDCQAKRIEVKTG
jgi:HSP20 family protein